MPGWDLIDFYSLFCRQHRIWSWGRYDEIWILEKLPRDII